MRGYKIETYLKIIFSISLFSLVSAYFIEYVLGHQPCNLCLLERIPYGLSIGVLVLNYVFKKNQKFFILLLILIFIFSFFISMYHFGIEQGFFQESTVCGLNSSSEIISKDELLRQLQTITISCKDVTFKIFGFSLTSFNMILSLGLIIILSKLFINYEKNKS